MLHSTCKISKKKTMPKTKRKKKTLEWKRQRVYAQRGYVLDGYHECGGDFKGSRGPRGTIFNEGRTFWEIFQKCPELCRKIEHAQSSDSEQPVGAKRALFSHLQALNLEKRRLTRQIKTRNQVYTMCGCFEACTQRGSHIIFGPMRELLDDADPRLWLRTLHQGGTGYGGFDPCPPV